MKFIFHIKIYKYVFYLNLSAKRDFCVDGFYLTHRHEKRKSLIKCQSNQTKPTHFQRGQFHSDPWEFNRSFFPNIKSQGPDTLKHCQQRHVQMRWIQQLMWHSRQLRWPGVINFFHGLNKRWFSIVDDMMAAAYGHGTLQEHIRVRTLHFCMQYKCNLRIIYKSRKNKFLFDFKMILCKWTKQTAYHPKIKM